MGKISPYTLGPKAVKAEAQNVTIKISWEEFSVPNSLGWQVYF
jgi:hypothetical protein